MRDHVNANVSMTRRCLAMLLTLCLLSALCFSLGIPAVAETAADSRDNSNGLTIVVADGEKVLMKDGIKVTAHGWYTTDDGKTVYVTYNTNGRLIAENYVIGGKLYLWTEDQGLVQTNGFGLVTMNGELRLYEKGKHITAYGWYTTSDGKNVYITYSARELIARDYVIGGKQYVWTEDQGLVTADGLVTVNGEFGLWKDGKPITDYGWHTTSDGKAVYITYSARELIARDYVIGGKQYIWTEAKGLVADGLLTVDGELRLYENGKHVTAWGWHMTKDGKKVYITWSPNNASGKLIAKDYVIGGIQYFWTEREGLVQQLPSEGLKFTLNSDGQGYSVTGIGTCTDTDIVIPATYNGKPVTSIGDLAFEYCSSLTSIEIPDSVTSIIGERAFSWCDSLTSITVKSGNTRYHSAGNCLIETASKTLIAGCQTSVIPTDGSVTSIGDMAFAYCRRMTSIEIPDSVTSIGEVAFSHCTSLTSIEIPDSVTSIGKYAFSGCSSLTSIEIPDSVTSIGYDAFRGCSSLTSIVIPDSVTSIGDMAFYVCSSLTSIVIPDSVTSIGDSAFGGCFRLTSITIGNSVTSIGEWAFDGCSSLTSIVIPDSVTSIGDMAFYGCSSLTSIVIPDSVTSIGDSAFGGCFRLTSITIGNSVTSIGYGAFEDCSSLTSITFKGTIVQWNEIDKAYNWNSNTGSYTIYCTDGTIKK